MIITKGNRDERSDSMNSNIESVGTAQVIYTVEPDPENEGQALVTYWLPNGQRIGSMNIPKK